MSSPQPSPSVSPLGYLALIAQYDLRCPRPRLSSQADSRVRTVSRSVDANGFEEVRYPGSAYRPRTGMADHLEFALKNEPLDLTVLAALFELEDVGRELQAWLETSPSSRYARVAGHLYEWLSARTLAYRLPAGAARVAVLDPEKYVVGPRLSNPRFGVFHNLIGSRAMSPLVRRTPAIAAFLAADLKGRIAAVIAAIDPGLLERAVNYLYLAETQSSFAIEQEIPSQERRERFRRLLEHGGAPGPLTEDRLVGWQQEIIREPLRQESSYRVRQNWLSRGDRRATVEYVPPAPRDTADLMQGVADIAAQGASGQLEPVIAAACASFGMVFVHPFLDGNGRLHRFLLHHILRQCGVTPKSVVLPLSVALQARLQDYAAVLQAYSRPRTALLDYRLDPETNAIDVRGFQPAWLYAYFDATQLCELVMQCIEQALDDDLPTELAWLQAYDAAMRGIESWLDGEQSQLDLLVRLIVQNNGHLSRSKRPLFERLTDNEIVRTEAIVRDAFAPWFAMVGKVFRS